MAVSAPAGVLASEETEHGNPLQNSILEHSLGVASPSPWPLAEFLKHSHPRDPATYADAFVGFVQAETAARTESEGPSSANEVDAKTIHSYMARGDWNGDAAQDPVLLEFAIGAQAYQLVARDHQVGAEIWNVSLPLTLMPALMVLEQPAAANVDDVLLGSFTIGQEADVACTPEDVAATAAACVAVVRWPFEWNLRALDGASGPERWNRSYPGETRFVYGEAITPQRNPDHAGVHYWVRNAFVAPLPTSDHNGDGASDVVLQAYDFYGSSHATYASYYDPSRQGGLGAGGIVDVDLAATTTRAELVDGRTGAALLSREEVSAPGAFGAALVPVGDAVGTAQHDLLWGSIRHVEPPFACAGANVLPLPACEVPPRSLVDLEMIDGANLSTAWRRTVSEEGRDAAGVDAWKRDLDGDGRADLVLRGFNGYYPVHFRLSISGADGHELWRRDAHKADYAVLGPVGGGPGDDVLEFRDRTDNFDPWTTTFWMERYDGADGAFLLSTSQQFVHETAAFAYLVRGPVGDLDRDGVEEVALEWNWAIFGPSMVEFESTIHIESGRTGAPLRSLESPGYAVLIPFGDLVGQPGDDLLLLAATNLSPAGRDRTLAAFDGAADVPVWSRTDADRTAVSVLPAWPVRLADGPDASDPLEVVLEYQSGDAWWSHAALVGGVDGVEAWRVGDGPAP